MKRFIKITLLASLAILLLESDSLLAQNAGGGGGRRNRATQGAGNNNNQRNFDPAQMQQRMMDRYKETLGVTNEDEWKVIQARLEKVMEAQREVRSSANMGRMMGNRRGGQGSDNTQANNNPRRGGMFGATPNPAAEALQKALDDNASADEIKAKLSSLRASRKAAEAKLESAQEDLKKVLTQKQEARLVLAGLLK